MIDWLMPHKITETGQDFSFKRSLSRKTRNGFSFW